MPTTVTLTSLVKNADGSVTVGWNDGQGRSYQSLQDFADEVKRWDTNSDLTKELALAYLLARSPDLSSLAPVLNKPFTFDLAAAQPIRVQ